MEWGPIDVTNVCPLFGGMWLKLWAEEFLVSGAPNFGLTWIYYNLSNYMVGIIYWLSTATHRFRRSSNSGQGIQPIMFFKRIQIMGGLQVVYSSF